MMLVVIGHIGVHIIEQAGNFLVLADYGVAIFFSLSGFGLSRSYQGKIISLGNFIRRRFSRVMVPYFIVTIIIVTLDYILLQRTYTFPVIESMVPHIGIAFAKEIMWMPCLPIYQALRAGVVKLSWLLSSRPWQYTEILGVLPLQWALC